ncbi:ion channel [Cyathus striatus]|nr:ion channel [Cyathus striatus]
MANQNYRDSEDQNDSQHPLLDAESRVENRVKSIWNGFVDFALRESVLEVAVGLIIASAFTKVVNSLVSDLILPPLSLLPFMSKNLEEKFLVLKKGPKFSKLHGYNTRELALEDGAVIWTYGAFLDQLTTFIGIGLVLYGLASLYGFVTKDSIIRHTRRCPFCRKEISAKAKRCPMCTSWLNGRDDEEESSL